MLYSKDSKIATDQVILQIHIPRTSGTSQRFLLSQILGQKNCLLNYRNEFSGLSSEQLDSYRLIVGHVGYGQHLYLSKSPVYITTVRDPLERIISLYATLLTNPGNRYHQYAKDIDINQFVLNGLNSDNEEFRSHFNNQQCRLICGEANFAKAREFIDTRYFLASPFPEREAIFNILSNALGANSLSMPHINETKERMQPHKNRVLLSSTTLDLLLESEKEDLLLYHYVQAAFAKVAAQNGHASLFDTTPAAILDLSEQVSMESKMLQYLQKIKTTLENSEFLQVRLPVVPASSELAYGQNLQLKPLSTLLWQYQTEHSSGLAFNQLGLLNFLQRANIEVRAVSSAPTAPKQVPVEHLLLKKRAQPSASTLSNQNQQVDACNICGGEIFAYGPGKRMASNGRAPCCLTCGSLERHRIAYSILQALPCGLLLRGRSLQIGLEIPHSAMLGRLDSISCDAASLPGILAQRGDEEYQMILLGNVLAQVRDDRAAFAQILRMLTRDGVLIANFGFPQRLDHSVHHEQAIPPWATYHIYGRDVLDYFSAQTQPLFCIELQPVDPSTGETMPFQLFCKNAERAQKLANYLSTSLQNC